MKLTTEDVNFLKSHKSVQYEGFVKSIFNKVLRKKIRNSDDFKQSVKDTDIAMTRLQNSIRVAEKGGTIIPDELKRFAGL